MTLCFNHCKATFDLIKCENPDMPGYAYGGGKTAGSAVEQLAVKIGAPLTQNLVNAYDRQVAKARVIGYVAGLVAGGVLTSAIWGALIVR